jgi:dipeptidyl aminopeptidase/acylaminoacyl peptidase
MKYFAFIILFLTSFYLGLIWYFSSLILNPVSSLEQTQTNIQTVWGSSFEELMAPLPEPIDFTAKAFDGIELQGKYFARRDTAPCVIIMAHGWTNTWAGLLKHVPVLSDCACDLVMFDHRGHGKSGRAYPTGSINESKDVIAVTEWVQKNKGFSDAQTGWYGESWGASAVLKAGAANKNVAFIIADAPFQDWYSAIFERAVRDYGEGIHLVSSSVMSMVNWRTGINYEEASPLNAASKIVEPVLLIHSLTDEQTGSQQSVNISKQLNKKSVFHHLNWGGGHTEDVRINRDKYQSLINNFLKGVDERFLK